MSKPATMQRSVVRKKKLKVALDSEIQKAQERIRTIDVATSVLSLAVGALSYLFVIILLDSWVRLPDLVRQITFGIITLAGLAYLYWAVVKPLLLKVNPYFAAKLLENSTPESKNSLINWLDLKEQPLNPIIRDAVEKRAASELQSADVETAIPSKIPLRLGFLTAALFLGLIVFALLVPDQFASFFRRALLPFQPTIVPTHTRLELIQPVADPVQVDPEHAPALDIEVAPGEPVPFAVLIHGAQPKRVILEYQPTLTEKPVQREMQAPRDEQRTSPWTLTFPSDAIPSDGLWFRIKANDGQTRQYRLVVSSRKPPSVSSVEAELTYPAYVNRSPTRQAFAPLRAMIGTKAMLWIQADQPVQDGNILIMVRNPEDQRLQQHRRIALKPLPNQDERSSARMLMLEEPITLTKEMQPGAMYRIALTNMDGKVGSSPEYPIEVEPDGIPRAEILSVHDQIFALGQPLPQIELAVNDVVTVRGEVQDDVAVDSARLKLKLQNGPELGLWGSNVSSSQLQEANGYPLPPAPVQFTLDLTKVSDLLPPANGAGEPPAQFMQLKPDQILELWIEACDRAEPESNVGKSKVLLIKLKPPMNKDERQKKEDQTKKDEKENQEQKQQQEQKKQQQKQQPKQNQNDTNKQDQKDQGQQGDKDNMGQGDQSKEQKGTKGDQQDKSKPQKDDKSQQDKGDKGDKSQPQKGDKGDKEDKTQADKSQPQKGDKGDQNKNEQTTKNDQKSDSKEQGPSTGKQPTQEQLDQIVKAMNQKDPNQGGNTGGGNLGKNLPVPDKADPEHLKRATDLMLESIRDKIQKGEIDTKLAQALKDANLTPQQALDLIKKRDKLGGLSTGRTTDVRKLENQSDVNTSLNLDVRHNPPPELERAFRKFTQERASRGSGQPNPKP